MAFSTFQINTLPEDSQDDYQIEFTTADMMVGVGMSKDEFIAVAQAMLDAADGEFDRWDGAKATDMVGEQ